MIKIVDCNNLLFYDNVITNDHLNALGGGGIKTHFSFTYLEITQTGIDVGIHLAPINHGTAFPLSISFSDAAPEGIVSGYGDFATWVQCYYVERCNPDSGTGTTKPWVPDATIIQNHDGSMVFTGTLQGVGKVELIQASLGGGWEVGPEGVYADDVGQVWPSIVAYLDYCMHRVDGGPLGGSWSLVGDPSAISLKIHATVGGKSGTVVLYYNPISGMFAYGNGYDSSGISHDTSGFVYFTPYETINSAIEAKQYAEYYE